MNEIDLMIEIEIVFKTQRLLNHPEETVNFQTLFSCAEDVNVFVKMGLLSEDPGRESMPSPHTCRLVYFFHYSISFPVPSSPYLFCPTVIPLPHCQFVASLTSVTSFFHELKSSLNMYMTCHCVVVPLPNCKFLL